MTPDEAAEITQAVKVHFAPGSSYDFFKYEGKLRRKKGKVDQSIKWNMVKFCREFTEIEFPYFCALTFYNNPKLWMKRLFEKEHVQTFRDWQVRQTKRVDLLKSELSGLNIIELGKKKDRSYPKLFSMIGEKIGTDRFVILDTYLGITKYWDYELKGDFAYSHWVGRYRKFRPFVFEYMPYDRASYANTIDTLIKEK